MGSELQGERSCTDSSWIVVIRLSSMGDVVHATAALEPLKAKGFKICFVTKKSFAPLLTNHPQIDEVFSFVKDEGEQGALDRLLAWIEHNPTSLIVDLHDSWRTFLWRKKLKKFAPVVVAKKERLREILILYFRLGRWLGFGRGGRAKKYQAAALRGLAMIGQTPTHLPVALTTLAISKDERDWARQQIKEKSYVVLLPGSAWAGKKWREFSTLATALSANHSVVILGDREFETPAASKFAIYDFQAKTSIRESMALVANAALVIGNDTGMLHVAEAFDTPTISIEGPTHPELGFSTYREKRSLLLGKNLFCRPCSKSGKICWRGGSHLCLRSVSVAEVLQAAENSLC